ncbi:disease resistance protein RGA5-like [Lolium rigidum]|uniref:disease resistance protein RGA5-like n=1 Tax=Lolium rigidum TaxID=89674 RepID=UPI001F5C4164|nr:disease resistance protein RGA5-like [Lolium rigidum]
MEGALVSAATGALKPVVEKLFALLGDEYTRFKGVRDQIRFLTSELATMHAFLLKMSEEEEGGHDPLDQAWMKEVRELSYDMEESIDDFMLHVGDKDAKPDGFIDKIKHSLGKLGKMKTHRRIGKEIEDLKKQIIEVGERNARYRTGGVISKMSNLTIDPRALAIFEHASKLVGIEEPKAEIIKLLTEEQGCGLTPQNLKVVAIVGFGGIGKTTLANQVYQELKVQFQCSAFISVSRTPDMMSILRTILSEVSKQRYVDTEAGSIQHLISKVHDFLIGKRYFIVVDDIWSVGAWEIIQGNTKYEWEQVKVSIGCALERNPSVEGMMKIISLSYFDLPAHLKTCLLYLSIFPEDAIIQKRSLIWSWIAEGFIYNEGRYTLYELGENSFVPEKLVLYHVRSFYVFGHLGEIPSLDRFRHLRVLNFEYCHGIENRHIEDIERLLQLRYLNLRGTRVSKLPQRIGDLWCLEMLDLRGTSVRELPASVVNLKKLVHLLVNFTVKFPDGIAKMQALESYMNVKVPRYPINFLQKLDQLKNLKKLRLDFEDVSNTRDENGVTEEYVKANVSPLQNLDGLHIWKNIKTLHVMGSTITRIPNSVGSLLNLRSVFLRMDLVGKKDLCILGGLPLLLKLGLSIGKCEGSHNIRVIVSGAQGFSCLRSFCYDISGAEMDFMFTAGSMPKLEVLITYFDIVKIEAFTPGDFDFGIENLTCLTTIKCGVFGRKSETDDTTKAAMERNRFDGNLNLCPRDHHVDKQVIRDGEHGGGYPPSYAHDWYIFGDGCTARSDSF